MNIHAVNGGNGVRLHVREWGSASGPSVLFIHGWSQNHLCWEKQYESDLARSYRLVAFDLRGHGMSEAPREASAYQEAQLWADDIAAIIADLHLERPILVGWSYGGFVISDYVRTHGQGKISGIMFAGAAVTLNQAALGTLIGPGFLDIYADATSDDFPANIRAMRTFTRTCTHKPLPQNEYETALSWSIAVPAYVRAALTQREINSDDVLSSLHVPLLVTQGRQDTTVLPAMAEHILKSCPTAVASWYDDTAHAPFLEDPIRFNQELVGLIQQTHP
jgi:non-heme chloroperoxidase